MGRTPSAAAPRCGRTAAGTGRLAVVLGDQLTLANPALARIDRARDTVLMVEASGEATHVWSHRARIAMFVAAMRHFAEKLRTAPMPANLARRCEGERRDLVRETDALLDRPDRV